MRMARTGGAEAPVDPHGMEGAEAGNADSNRRSLYRAAGAAALVALSATLLDVILGFGETDIIVNGSMTAVDWFALFRDNGFKGLYTLGLLNLVYQTCLVPVFFALYMAHRRVNGTAAALAMIVSFIGMAVYVANNAAVPMFVLSSRYAAAATEAQRALFAAAGEAVLARGEDFTPGSFIGLLFQGAAAAAVSFVLLRGRIFGRATAWIGMIGFTFLTVFTILATFVPVLYYLAFYGFGMTGGLLALAWFALVALQLFRLGRSGVANG